MNNPDVTEQPAAPTPVACSDLLGLQMQANAALTCLYIAVDERVAKDVNDKVRAYISALEMQIPKQTDYFEKSQAQES